MTRHLSHSPMPRLALAAFWFAVTATPAGAAHTLTTSIITQPYSPLRIDACTANLSDTNVGNANYYINRSTSVTDLDPRGVIAYRLRFDISNAFGESLSALYGVDSDPVYSGKNGTGTWQQITPSTTADTVRCSVDTVKFVTGEIWHASDGKAAPTPGPSFRDCKDPDREPAIVTAAKPVELEVARQQGIVGIVNMRLRINPDGTLDPGNSVVIQSPSALLNAPALSAAAASIYKPAQMNCVPVPGYITVGAHFQ